VKNYAASVRARLLNAAREQNEDFNRILVRYLNERLLYRLSQSAHASAFVLKGATLFHLWLDQPHRPSKDIDLLGQGEPDIDRLVQIFQEIVEVACPEDGVLFEGQGIGGESIREEARYGGVRISIPASLAGAKAMLQVDVGVGDAIVPPPTDAWLPTLLDHPAPRLRAYPKETVVAEKLEALVTLGITNSRMKDYFDLALLQRRFVFDETLVRALAATFQRRGTPLPLTLPIGLSEAFATDGVKQTQWSAFLKKAGAEPTELRDVVSRLRDWLWPVLQQASEPRATVTPSA
jgi:predicted nucleotidyltransferase component of viral defense system